MGLGLNIGFGVGTGGAGPMVGVKPSFSIPDTPETGINLANELIGTVNRRIGSILQHEGYSKTPFITLRTNQQGQPQPGVMPQAMPGSQAPPLTSTVPPRTWGVLHQRRQDSRHRQRQARGQRHVAACSCTATGRSRGPPQTRRPPAPRQHPTQQPTPPTATSTPAQDEAYRQSQGPGQTPGTSRHGRRQAASRRHPQATPAGRGTKVHGAGGCGRGHAPDRPQSP